MRFKSSHCYYCHSIVHLQLRATLSLCSKQIFTKSCSKVSWRPWKLRDKELKMKWEYWMWVSNQEGKRYCPWILAHIEVSGSNVFVAFSNFLAESSCAFLLPGVLLSRPGWKRSQSRAEVWGLLKWFSF